MNKSELWENLDISDTIRLERLSDSADDILSIILDGIPVGVGLFELGETVRAVYLNEAFFTCIGFTKEAYQSKLTDVLQTIHEEDVESFREQIYMRAPQMKDIRYTLRGYRGNGDLGWFHVRCVPVENKQNDNPLYLAMLTDIPDKSQIQNNMVTLKEVNKKLQIQEERYKILEGTAQGLLFEFYPDLDKMVFSYNFPNNKKRKEIKNYSEYIKTSPLVHSSHIDDFKKALFDACKQEKEGQMEYLSSVSGGGYRWHLTYYKSVADSDGRIISVIGRIKDIHDSKMEQEKLNYKADMDGLTNLYRKEAAFEKMQEYVEEAPGSECYFTILDLDDFKRINDQYGHQYGDEVLRKTADELRILFDENSILGRFGGDEFIILTRSIPYDEVHASLKQLKKKIRFCAGIVKWENGEDIKSIFDKADRAMYQVKLSDKNGIHLFEEEL